MVDDGAFGEEPGVADEEGDADGFFVERAFVAGVVFAEVVAIVAGVDDDGVVGEAEGIEGVEETCDVVIDAGDVAEVVEMDIVGGEPGGLGAVGGGFVEDGGDPAVRGGAAGLACVEIAETGWEIVAAARAVRAFEAEDDGERLFLVLADEVDGEVGGDVVGPALGGGGGCVDVEWTILVLTLTDVAGGVVEAWAGALIAHVPFADVGGLVAGGAEEGGVGDGIGGERTTVVSDAVEVIVAAGEEGGAAGSAEGERDEGVAEADTFGGETVHAFGLEPWEAGLVALFALDRADGVPAVVVGIDEEEVGFAVCGEGGGAAEREEDEEEDG